MNLPIPPLPVLLLLPSASVLLNRTRPNPTNLLLLPRAHPLLAHT
jgi:hypothetical protein